MGQLDGKIAVITGSTQGLGAAIANLFAERGAAGIVTCGRTEQNGIAVAENIAAKTGCKMRFVRANLESVDDCRAVIGQAKSAFGTIDILVNAAGMTDRGDILDTSPQLFDALFAVNVRAPFFLIQEAAKIMITNATHGAMINIGSTSAMAGQPFISAYCASKGALATLTRNTAFALLRNRIRVNQLNIGWMASDGEDQIQRSYHGAGDDWLEQAAAGQPFGRLIAPDEVARAVAFLACKESGMMTGSVVNFDQSVWGAYEAAPPTPTAPFSVED
jgi:NAD(P)-dependent dehydrogenase (short-subunit alcohol dehydrogenase family)